GIKQLPDLGSQQKGVSGMKGSGKARLLLHAFFFLATLAVAQNNITQIQHVILVIQENRTPTNLFHEDQNLVSSGAHVIPPNNQGPCGPEISNPPSGVKCDSTIQESIAITLTGVDYATDPGANHEHYPGFFCTYNSGNMNGACHNPPTGT